MSELNRSGGFLISQEGDVRKIYRQLRIWPGREPEPEQLRVLADRLMVDTLITGRIIEMSETANGREVHPKLTVMLRILEAKSGRTLWTTYHRREGREYRKVMHFGLVNTMAVLARRISQEALELWFREGMDRCRDMSE